MKTRRTSAVILIVLVVVLAALAGYVYYSYNKEVKHKQDLLATVTKNQQIINNNAKAITAKNDEAAALASQLAQAKASLAAANFPSDVQSIEYDQLFFQMAVDASLKVTNVSASPLNDVKEGTTTYQSATYNISVEGLTPAGVFKSEAESSAFNDSVVSNILTYVDKLAVANEMRTGFIESVNITTPPALTADEIKALESPDTVQKPSAVITVTIWTIKGA